MTRPTMDETLMSVARVMGARSTCPRSDVGCVLSKDGRILSSGYNGAPSGMKHCSHASGCEGCEEYDGMAVYDVWGARHKPSCIVITGCPTAIHAEANAIAFAARHGVSLVGSTLHTTLSPCRTCAQLLIQVGVLRVVANRQYRLTDGVDLLGAALVEVTVVNG